MPIISDPGDVNLNADSGGSGKGRIVFSIGRNEVAAIQPNGTGTGLLGGSLSSKASLLSRLTPLSYQPPTILSADAPTITFGTSQTVVPARRISGNANDLRLYGQNGPNYWNDASTRADTYGVSTLDFFYTGLSLEISIRCNVTGVLPFLLAVDGLQVTAAADVTTITTAVNATIYFIKLTWGTSKTRRIEFSSGGSNAFAGLYVGLNDGVAPAPARPSIAWVSDSFWSGVAGAFVNIDGAAFVANRTLGGGLFLDAIGGTGYVTPGSATTFWSSTRAPLVTYVAPELIVVQGSTNDDGVASATIQTAARTMYAAIAAALPSTPVIVFGVPPNNGSSTTSANRAANIAAVKTAALASPNVIGFHDEVGTAAGVPAAWSSVTAYVAGDRVTYRGSVWKAEYANTNKNPVTGIDWSLQTYVLYGTGQVGTTAGDGNRDIMLYSDGTHPTAVGQTQWAAQIAAEVRADILNYATGGAIRVT